MPEELRVREDYHALQEGFKMQGQDEELMDFEVGYGRYIQKIRFNMMPDAGYRKKRQGPVSWMDREEYQQEIRPLTSYESKRNGYSRAVVPDSVRGGRSLYGYRLSFYNVID